MDTNIKYVLDKRALAKAIEKRKLTANQLASQIGISRNTISRTLNAHTSPKLDVIHLIVRGLQLTEQEILSIFFKCLKGAI